MTAIQRSSKSALTAMDDLLDHSLTMSRPCSGPRLYLDAGIGRPAFFELAIALFSWLAEKF